MILFKAAGSTYPRVVNQALHAFPYSPAEVHEHELVVLSKNREDCASTESQIQCLAKLLRVRAATPSELDERFPNEAADKRWKYIVELYWSRRLDRPFNLSQVRGFNYRRYDTVQNFARLDSPDEQAFFDHLIRSNPRIVVDFLNAEPPAAAG